jgi:hypothetical protein
MPREYKNKWDPVAVFWKGTKVKKNGYIDYFLSARVQDAGIDALISNLQKFGNRSKLILYPYPYKKIGGKTNSRPPTHCLYVVEDKTETRKQEEYTYTGKKR